MVARCLWLSVLLLCILELIAYGAFERPRLDQPIRNPAVVHLQSEVSACAGFVVAQDVVVSAGHCVSGSFKTKIVQFVDGTFQPYTVLYATYFPDGGVSPDYAIIGVKTGRVKPIKLDPTASLGAIVTHIGYPHTQIQITSFGFLFAWTQSINRLWIANASFPGDSGGPVLDKNGSAIGIVTIANRVVPVTFAFGIGPVKTQLANLGVLK